MAPSPFRIKHNARKPDLSPTTQCTCNSVEGIGRCPFCMSQSMRYSPRSTDSAQYGPRTYNLDPLPKPKPEDYDLSNSKLNKKMRDKYYELLIVEVGIVRVWKADRTPSGLVLENLVKELKELGPLSLRHSPVPPPHPVSLYLHQHERDIDELKRRKPVSPKNPKELEKLVLVEKRKRQSPSRKDRSRLSAAELKTEASELKEEAADLDKRAAELRKLAIRRPYRPRYYTDDEDDGLRLGRRPQCATLTRAQRPLSSN